MTAYALWAGLVLLVLLLVAGWWWPARHRQDAAALYAGAGQLNIVVVALIGFVAAVLGDNIGFASAISGTAVGTAVRPLRLPHLGPP
ncbi:MAG: hypothetical protein ACRDQU_21775 [Pseudonocardiaceae bacterium]